MEKSKLERFISKYNIGGACESVKFVSNGTEMSVRSISDDKNVLAEIISHDMSRSHFLTHVILNVHIVVHHFLLSGYKKLNDMVRTQPLVTLMG